MTSAARFKRLSARRFSAALLLAALGVGCVPRAFFTPWAPTRSPPAEVGSLAPTFPLDARESDALDADRFTPRTSAALAVALVALPYGIILALAAMMAARHAMRARAERACSPTAPLRDGPAVVFGTVASEPASSEPFIRITIAQKGAESQSEGRWSHTWTETSRTTSHRPFTLVRDDGVEVRVEPDAHVALHDDHSRIERSATDARTRFAEITAGERVQVTGDLSGASRAAAHDGAYRAPQGAAVLRVPSSGRMVISTEAPGAVAASRARVHLRWALGIVAAALFVSTAVAPVYASLSRSSSVVQTQPVSTRTWRERRGIFTTYWQTHWVVRGEYSDHGRAVTVSDDVGVGVFRCVQSGRCTRVPFVVSTDDPRRHQFGVAPSLTTRQCVFFALLCWGLCLGYWMNVMITRPWYMEPRVFDTGEGRLDASTP